MMLRRWSIYHANLDPVIGSEQGKSRPVLVVSEDAINGMLQIVNVLPITSRKPGRKVYPNEVLIPANNFGLRNESIVMCHQIRTLDKKRMTSIYGSMTDPAKQVEIKEALCFQLGIE